MPFVSDPGDLASAPTGYQTKDSGERISYASGMQRDVSTGKPRFDLTDPLDVPAHKQLDYRVAELLARGAEKYSERNWEQADSEAERTRALESARRHFMQWWYINMLGPENVPREWLEEDHAAAVVFNEKATERLNHVLGFDALVDGFRGANPLETS